MTERERILYNAGMYEKIYAPISQDVASEDFPEFEWNEDKSDWRFYRLEVAQVTDEEFELIKQRVQDTTPKKSEVILANEELKSKKKVVAENQSNNETKPKGNMFSGNLKKSVPKTIDEILTADKVVANLWTWAERIERWGKVLLALIIVFGTFVSIAVAIAEDSFAVFLYIAFATIVASLLEYLTFHIIALFVGTIASIAQNTKISADIALYNLKK